MRQSLAIAFSLIASSAMAQSQFPPPPAPPPGIDVPDWALPNSPTHRQIPPPDGFHRPSVTNGGAIGLFEAQTDVGGPLVPGSSSYNPATKTYSITSAGYNIWYQRDEFRYLWKRASGDLSFAVRVVWPNSSDFHDRKVALVIRDSLNDDSRTIVAAQHGSGLMHIAWRSEKSAMMSDFTFRGGRQPDPTAGEKQSQPLHPTRFGIEKRGDQFQLWVSWQGEPMSPLGRPVTFKTSGPFFVGIGFTSHLPATPLTAQVTDVVLENTSGKMR